MDNNDIDKDLCYQNVWEENNSCLNAIIILIIILTLNMIHCKALVKHQ